MKELALIILNWNGSEDTIECLDSLFSSDKAVDIVILDNASKPEQLKILESNLESRHKDYISVDAEGFDKDVITDEVSLYLVKSKTNLGFAAGNNFIAERICEKYEYVLLLNNDTIVPKDSIQSMLNTIEKRSLVAVTCDIRYNYDRSVLWNAGGNFKWYGDRKYFSQKKIDRLKSKGVTYIKAQYITGCALMIDCEYIRKYKLFTDKFFHGEEDYNLCYRLKKHGYAVGVDLSVQIYHKVGQSIKRDDDGTKVLKSSIVHYLNRIIDYKEFYGKLRWKMWRTFYINLVILKRKLSGFTRSQAKLLKNKLYYYSNNFENVKWEVFSEIMNG